MGFLVYSVGGRLPDTVYDEFLPGEFEDDMAKKSKARPAMAPAAMAPAPMASVKSTKPGSQPGAKKSAPQPISKRFKKK